MKNKYIYKKNEYPYDYDYGLQTNAAVVLVELNWDPPTLQG